MVYQMPLALALSRTAAAAAKSLQSCPTLCDPIDGSPPGSAVPGILQARVLEWGSIAFSLAGRGLEICISPGLLSGEKWTLYAVCQCTPH